MRMLSSVPHDNLPDGIITVSTSFADKANPPLKYDYYFTTKISKKKQNNPFPYIRLSCIV